MFRDPFNRKRLLACLFLLNGPVQIWTGLRWLGLATLALGVVFAVQAYLLWRKRDA
jgi:hypothetical protein